ncbi:MAG: PTS glucose transporter subunit IIA [Erysipelotrichaceae bacterium]|nr:PTS glucose transporter subunit IIA [Erysipelotrichaceae bacterium]
MPEVIYSPFEGKAIRLEEVKDDMFSQKLLGDGVAIYPDFKTGLFAKKTDLFAPVDGEVCLLFKTGHAIGFKTPEGKELLMHIGIDTVNLQGAPFTIFVKQGDTVHHGQKIGEVDFKMITKKGLDTVTPVIWTNSEGNPVNVLTSYGEVTPESELYTF